MAPDTYTASPTEMATAAPTPDVCGDYCSTTGCGWTAQWSCPWAAADGTVGRAGDDGSVGYDCCCNQHHTCGIETYTPSPTVTPTYSGAVAPGCNCMNPLGCTGATDS